MQLRPYQTEVITAVTRDWHTHQDLLLVMATGGGKTQCFLQIAMDVLDAEPRARCLVIAHREELIFQPLERVRQMNSGWLGRGALDCPRLGVVMADRDDCNRQLTIATIQTLSSEARLARLLAHGPITHLIIDECHHATARTYLALWERLRTANPELRHLGVTATPIRADGDGLSKVYSHVSARVTIADLVRDHYLVQPRWLGISTGISVEGVQSRAGDFVASQLANRFDTDAGRSVIVRSYQQYAGGRRAIAFTASVAGAHDLAAAFCAAGVSACAVDGTTPKDERRRIMDDFRAGRFQILTNCQVATEGFDAPGASCVLMCRPTRSDSLYVQMMGRGLRPAGNDPLRPGMAMAGEDCLILDFLPENMRNIVMAGDVLGLPKEVTREVAKKTTEPGMVQAGFTFDGESFNTDGTPLEIVARQLDYLSASPFVWYRRDGWLTLGLGEASDSNERILAIAPHGPPWQLYGLLRKKGTYDWRSKLIDQGADLAELGEQGNTIAARWGSGALIGKGRSWHSQSATDGQRRWLHKLACGALKIREIDLLSKGECASLITHFQAVRELGTRLAAAQYEEVSA